MLQALFGLILDFYVIWYWSGDALRRLCPGQDLLEKQSYEKCFVTIKRCTFKKLVILELYYMLPALFKEILAVWLEIVRGFTALPFY